MYVHLTRHDSDANILLLPRVVFYSRFHSHPVSDCLGIIDLLGPFPLSTFNNHLTPNRRHLTRRHRYLTHQLTCRNRNLLRP